MSTGHTHASAGSVQRFGKAQCNASIEPGAALGDRLRRIETSIEDLSRLSVGDCYPFDKLRAGRFSRRPVVSGVEPSLYLSSHEFRLASGVWRLASPPPAS